MEEEQLEFVVLDAFLDTLHQDVHNPAVDILSWVQVADINESSNLEGVIADAQDEQVNELLVGDLGLGSLLELLVVVFFAIHLEHDVDVFSCYQEPLSVVLGDSGFNLIVNYNLLVVRLVVLAIS